MGVRMGKGRTGKDHVQAKDGSVVVVTGGLLQVGAKLDGLRMAMVAQAQVERIVVGWSGTSEEVEAKAKVAVALDVERLAQETRAATRLIASSWVAFPSTQPKRCLEPSSLKSERWSIVV